jgi:drug/metabolite transporter (DMT)-like permease
MAWFRPAKKWREEPVMRLLAFVLLFLNPVLWASFYAISKKALHQVDPISFATFELSVAAVPALVLAAILHKQLTINVLRAGVLLGVILFAAVLGSTIALYYTTATNTAFFPALNGAFAAVITVAVLKKALNLGAIISVSLATAGALLVIIMSGEGGGNPMGDLISLGAAAVYTGYIFAVDNQASEKNSRTAAQLWAISCVEIVVMAILAWITLFIFGGSVSDMLGKPGLVVSALYVGVFTTIIPTIIALFFQKYVNPMTVALLYVLEPVWGAIAAWLIEGEVITMVGYIGGSLIIVGSIVNIFSTGDNKAAEQPGSTSATPRPGAAG